MTGWRLTPRAEADFEDIWEYTSEAWDDEQADRYALALEAGFDLISERPTRGSSCDELRPGCRRCRSGSHLVFYRSSDVGVEIIRILHERMDVPRHL